MSKIKDKASITFHLIQDLVRFSGDLGRVPEQDLGIEVALQPDFFSEKLPRLTQAGPPVNTEDPGAT